MSPFVVEDVRKKIRELGFGEADAVGDLCFIVYEEMMKRWNASPRWTTIHYIKKEFIYQPIKSEFLSKLAIDLALADKISLPGFVKAAMVAGDTETMTCNTGEHLVFPDTHKLDRDDIFVATELAFDVFMHFHGIEYEKKKRAENGDIL